LSTAKRIIELIDMEEKEPLTEDQENIQYYLHTNKWTSSLDMKENKVILTRLLNGERTVLTLNAVQTDPRDDQVEDSQDYFTVSFTHPQKSSAKALEFECCAVKGETLQIDKIRILDESGSLELPFTTLDEETQDLWCDYLDERDINDDFSEKILLVLDDYDQKYYRQLASKIKLFLRE